MSSHDTSSAAVGFRLSPQQEALLQGDEQVAVTQCAVALAAGTDAGRLQAALNELVAAHEILRTRFARVPGMRARQQVIADEAGVTLATAAAGGPLARGSDALAQALADAAQPGFDLEHGPLLRATLVSVATGGAGAEAAEAGEAGQALILTAAAACLDAPSMAHLLGQLAAAYAGQAGEEPLQYADYAEWRHEFLTEPDPSGDAGPAREFWRQAAALRPARGLLPTVGTDPDGVDAPADGCVAAFALRGEERARLRAAAGRAGVPESMMIEAIWHAVLARVTGSGELELATWVNGRSQADLAGAVGPYAQPVPIRTRTEVETSLAELVDQIARAQAGAERWADHGSAADAGALVAGAAAGVRVHAVAPLPAPVGEVLALRAPATPGLVTLELLVTEDAIAGELRSHPAERAAADVTALAGWLAHAVTGAAADPGQAAFALPLSSASQRDALLAAGAGPEPSAEAAVLFPEAFAAQARRDPGALAIADADGELSYGELDAASARLAHRLRAAGAGADVPVGLCLARSGELLVAVLGILRAGSAYVPLNPEHPVDRRLAQLADAGAVALVTDAGGAEELAGFDGELVCPARESAALAALPTQAPELELDPGDLAYVMYTSGSTGTPKGVAVTHANLANYVAALVHRLDAGAQPLHFGVVSAISTDLGNTTIFPALASGGSLAVIGAEAAMEPGAFAAALGSRPLDVLKIAPSHLGALLDPRTLPQAWLLIGGEALSWELVARIRALGARCRIVNHYGPTEATIGCCTYDVDVQPRTDCATVPVGFPIAGARVHVLDALGAPVPAGVAGELCVAGAGVAAGYVGDPAAADERFVPDPHGAGRMYRTGDRARRLRDGAIEFLGRTDDQVKVRGYRVEPGEIEAALSHHASVRQAAVVAEPEASGSARLVAYLAVSAPVTVEELQGELARTLPGYMIPSDFLILDALPLTPSGKVDRRALGRESAAEAGREAQYTAPRDAIEDGIAAIWAELLGVAQVGVHDDFFALGGHSLLATQAIMRIRRQHGEIPLRALLAAPTVAELADVVRAAQAAGAPSAGP